MHKIFKDDGKSVIVAMDHGMGLNVLPDLNDTGAILEKIIAGSRCHTYNIRNSQKI